ncbi:PLD nuclease N-terminal domain-containing protein [Micromonospora sonneratiae]|uniref:PLD nuclease N-terminal domain-containing protein n=1 Tax=Micromonospora sonneratiae TaxID=1184706 RepID=A0ABW3YBL9_9ACTN
MARLYALLFIVQIILAVCALISCLSAEEGDIRALPRLVWVLIILFFPLIGSIAWFLAGRPVPSGLPGRPGQAATGWRATGGSPEKRPTRPVAPDDDPEFLRSLDAQRSTQDQEMFRKWEEDLRRREDDLRRREAGDPPRDDTTPSNG